MKLIFSILILGLSTMSAFATDYQSTAIYCNGPITSGEVSACPSFSSWKGVRLKNLKSISLPRKPTDLQIRFLDSDGNIWEQQLASCNSKPSDLRGCTARVDFSKPDQISFHISIWNIGQRAQRLALFLDNHRQLSILPEEGDNLIFSLKEK